MAVMFAEIATSKQGSVCEEADEPYLVLPEGHTLRKILALRLFLYLLV